MTDHLRIWTLQPVEVWDELQVAGSLRADVTRSEMTDDFAHAYAWMRLQMRIRLPQYDVGYPWWAYGYKPDLRVQRHTLPPGQRFVRLQLAMPRERVLLSSYSEWHWVLGRDYLPLGDSQRERQGIQLEDDVLRQYRRQYGLPTRTVRSWERIFESVSEKSATDTIQAVFELLDLDRVEAYTEFSTINTYTMYNA